MKKLSIHRPSKKEFNLENFGHYLAGLIDGDGHISTIGHIVICFNEKDLKSAHKLRGSLGYGTIRKLKNKKGYNWVISNKEGILKTAALIKHKLKHPTRIIQYNTRLAEKLQIEKTALNSTINWCTPWFSGFFDADGHMRIYVLHRPSSEKHELRLLAQVNQKTDVLLKQFRQKFGGYLGYRKTQDTYYYSSTSFLNFAKMLAFFDQFSLQFDRSYLRYVILRKTYLLVQDKKHLSVSGYKTIQKYRKKLEEI